MSLSLQITDEIRETFDEMVQRELETLPEPFAGYVAETFVNVADRPDRAEMRRLGVTNPGDLLGSYTGVPLTRRGVHDSGRLPDRIVLYRLGILLRSRGRSGRIDPEKLRANVRRTLLHEVGHLHGMDEDDLAEYGYG
jgi:predicted Zn-dependent protease with MMP-like domain